MFLFPRIENGAVYIFLVGAYKRGIALVAFLCTWVPGNAVVLAVLPCSSPLGVWDIWIQKAFFAVSSDACPPELVYPVLLGVYSRGGPVLNILVFCPCERGFILGRPPSLIPMGNCIGEVDTLLLGCCLGCGCPRGTR